MSFEGATTIIERIETASLAVKKSANDKFEFVYIPGTLSCDNTNHRKIIVEKSKLLIVETPQSLVSLS